MRVTRLAVLLGLLLAPLAAPAAPAALAFEQAAADIVLSTPSHELVPDAGAQAPAADPPLGIGVWTGPGERVADLRVGDARTPTPLRRTVAIAPVLPASPRLPRAPSTSRPTDGVDVPACRAITRWCLAHSTSTSPS